VVPDRVRRSLAASLNATDRQRLAALPPGWLQALSSQWQGLDTRWQLWVMQFDSSSQQTPLNRWLRGQNRWQGLLAIAAIATAVAGALLVLLRLEPRQPQPDRWRRELNSCLRALANLQLEPRSGESLQAFCTRAAAQQPKLAPQVEELAQRYSNARFASAESSRQQPQLQALQRLRRQLWRHVRRPTSAA
jgi:hypothetical protein